MKTTYRRKTQTCTFTYFREGRSLVLRGVAGDLTRVDDTLFSERFKRSRINKRNCVVIKQGYEGIGSDISEC